MNKQQRRADRLATMLELLRDGEKSTAELARLSRMDASAVRYYCNMLVSDGLLTTVVGGCKITSTWEIARNA